MFSFTRTFSQLFRLTCSNSSLIFATVFFRLLCTLSVFLVATVFVLVFGSVVFDTRNIVPTYSSSAPLWNSVLTAYGILAFQFDIHPTILTIQVDMVDKRQIHKAIIGAFGSKNIATTSE